MSWRRPYGSISPGRVKMWYFNLFSSAVTERSRSCIRSSDWCTCAGNKRLKREEGTSYNDFKTNVKRSMSTSVSMRYGQGPASDWCTCPGNERLKREEGHKMDHGPGLQILYYTNMYFISSLKHLYKNQQPNKENACKWREMQREKAPIDKHMSSTLWLRISDILIFVWYYW